MKVETYEIEPSNEEQELIEGGMASQLIDDLGMTGQQAFLTGAFGTRMNYRVMTDVERKAIFYLFAAVQPYTQFNIELIPVRVLEAIKKAVDADFFEDIKIRYHQTGAIEDPFVIGERKEKRPSSTFERTEFYLIARWGNGDELLSIPELVTKARETWRNEVLTKLKRARREVEAAIANMQEDPDYNDLGQMPFYSF